MIVSDSLKGVAVVGLAAHLLALMLLMGTQAALCVGCEVLNLRFLLALASLACHGERGLNVLTALDSSPSLSR